MQRDFLQSWKFLLSVPSLPATTVSAWWSHSSCTVLWALEKK